MAKINVTHNGIVFTDSDELATYLNMSPNTLLAFLKQNYTVSEIIEHNKVLWPLAERRRLGRKAQISTVPGNHCRSCQVAGTVYPSQIAAARAYHIPIQTIYSRMQRQNLSFEEAVLHGYREEHLLSPVPELYHAYHDKLRQIEQPQSKSLADLIELLESAGLYGQAFQTDDGSVQAFQTSFEIWDGNTIEIWMLYLQDRELLETIIPKLCDGVDSNSLNGQTANIRFWVNKDGFVSASFSDRFPSGAKYVLRSLYQFLGACSQAKNSRTE